MKSLATCLLLLAVLQTRQTKNTLAVDHPDNIRSSANLIIVTIDGFRWQEVFSGADPDLINNGRYTSDTGMMKMLYWATNKEDRRKKLLPFFWNVLAAKGQLYGNRDHDNFVNTSNPYALSYPGYNEMFTGHVGSDITSNDRKNNTNLTVLEYLNKQPGFEGKVAAFTSWDVFPYILNREKNEMVINSGYEPMLAAATEHAQSLINRVQDEAIFDKTETRHDELTFLTAMQYLAEKKPRVLYLGLGETDEAAHAKQYDLYLEKAAQADQMIARLWRWIQTTPGYRNNTTLIITTDHGRGKRPAKWHEHGAFISGSSQTWLAVMGPTVEAVGEVKENQQIYSAQMAKTIAALVGEKFGDGGEVAEVLSLR